MSTMQAIARLCSSLQPLWAGRDGERHTPHSALRASRLCGFQPTASFLVATGTPPALFPPLMEPPQPGPLVPILRIDQVLGDRVALATWHEALSDSLSADLPHDLLGLWLYPREGGAVLLGPEALAQDDLAIPLPSPQLQPAQLALIEEIVRDAGSAPTACVPGRFGRRDVGLVLVADLRERMYDDEAVALLELVAQRLAPTFGRLVRQWNTAQGSQIFQLERAAALLDPLAQVSTGAPTPPRLAQALSHGLAPLLPHDRFELLLGAPTGSRYYRLGEHAGGAPWCDPSLLLERESLDLMALANG